MAELRFLVVDDFSTMRRIVRNLLKESGFNEADEAVSIANGTIYGLVSAVWTKDIQLAMRMAADIKAGSVWVNTYNGFDSASPFGGSKQSGFGRDLGAYALEQYTNIKSVWIAL